MFVRRYLSEERFGVHQLRTGRVRLQPGRAQHERSHDERARDHGKRGYPGYLNGSRSRFQLVRLQEHTKRQRAILIIIVIIIC